MLLVIGGALGSLQLSRDPGIEVGLSENTHWTLLYGILVPIWPFLFGYMFLTDLFLWNFDF